MSFVSVLKIQLDFWEASAENIFCLLQHVCNSRFFAHFDIFWSSFDEWEELKDRFMIYFAFHRFLSDTKLTEIYFCVSLHCFCIAFIPTFWHINCTFTKYWKVLQQKVLGRLVGKTILTLGDGAVSV